MNINQDARTEYTNQCDTLQLQMQALKNSDNNTTIIDKLFYNESDDKVKDETNKED